MAKLGNGPVTLQPAAVAPGNGAAYSVTAFEAVTVRALGPFVGTILLEGSILDRPSADSDWDTLLTITAPGAWTINSLALAAIRAPVSVYTSGTITVMARGATS